MSKNTDLQKAVEEIRATLQDKDFEKLKNAVLAKVQSNGNIADLLQDSSLQATLQNLMRNPNVANLLRSPELSNQLASLLNSQGQGNLLAQLQNALNNFEKKKIDNQTTQSDGASQDNKLSQNILERLQNPVNLLDTNAVKQEMAQLKEEILTRYETNRYAKEIKLLDAVAPFVAPEKADHLKKLREFYCFKGFLEDVVSPTQEATPQSEKIPHHQNSSSDSKLSHNEKPTIEI